LLSFSCATTTTETSASSRMIMYFIALNLS
jgi:hypothetical protein